MTGPECFQRALELAQAVEDGERTEVVLPLAQVCATLALAAATIDASIGGPDEIRHEQQWREVLS